MEPRESNHEKLASRLAGILLKLNLGDSFSVDALAEEYKVSDRTVFRDLGRLSSIVDRLPDGRYQLAPLYRGKFNQKDLEALAKLTGVDQLFPDSGHRFLIALLDTLSQSSFLVKGQQYEQPKPNDRQFAQLDQAIREHRICRLTYNDKQRILEPYRLVNNTGIWYLAATENGQLKAYSFSRINSLFVTDDSFSPKADVQEQIEDEDDIWFSRDKTEVLLSVSPQIAYYFQRRKLLPRQETVKELDNGGLIISSQISHEDQILPLIRYWIPRIKIIEPIWLQAALENELRQYVQ